MQLVYYFLKPTALSKRFENIQQLAWECHPLYSPDLRHLFLPPHCKTSQKLLVTRDIKVRQSVQNICDVSHPEPRTYEGNASSNQSSLFNALVLETRNDNNDLREPSSGSFGPQMVIGERSRGRGERSNATASDAISDIPPARPELEVDQQTNRFEQESAGVQHSRYRVPSQEPEVP